MKNSTFAVIGLGVFGTAIAKKLAERGADVIAVDEDLEKVESIAKHVMLPVQLNATNKEALRSQNIHKVDAAVVSIGSNFEMLLLCIFQLQAIGVKRIIARAQGSIQRDILTKMGVADVLSPEVEFANNIAEQLTNPGVLMCVQLPDNYELIEVEAPPKVIGRTLADIGLREKYNINLVTVLRKDQDGHHIYGVPNPESVINKEDIVLVFGKENDINRFMEVNA